MPDTIKSFDDQISSLQKKRRILLVPVIMGALIGLGVAADAVARISRYFQAEDAFMHKKMEFGNANLDLKSFSDPENVAGFMISLEDELGTIVNFEPKYPELRIAIETLFRDFSLNMSDWNDERIEGTDEFKLKLAALTADLENVADEDLIDVLRSVNEEVTLFKKQLLSNRPVPPSESEFVLGLAELLASVGIALGAMLLVGDRLSSMDTAIKQTEANKVFSIREEVLSWGGLDSAEEEYTKKTLLRLLVDMTRDSQSKYSYVFARNWEIIFTDISDLYDLPADKADGSLQTIKEHIELFKHIALTERIFGSETAAAGVEVYLDRLETIRVKGSKQANLKNVQES